MLGAHPLPGGPLRRLSQPIRERTCCQRPPALWDVNLSAVRRTPITTHTLRVRRNVALTRKIADSRGQPAAASSARISGRQVGSRPTTGPRTASGKAGLSCSAAFLCTVPPRMVTPRQLFCPAPPAPRTPVPRPPVPDHPCRRRPARRPPAAPPVRLVSIKMGWIFRSGDIELGGVRIFRC